MQGGWKAVHFRQFWPVLGGGDGRRLRGIHEVNRTATPTPGRVRPGLCGMRICWQADSNSDGPAAFRPGQPGQEQVVVRLAAGNAAKGESDFLLKPQTPQTPHPIMGSQ